MMVSQWKVFRGPSPSWERGSCYSRDHGAQLSPMGGEVGGDGGWGWEGSVFSTRRSLGITLVAAAAGPWMLTPFSQRCSNTLLLQHILKLSCSQGLLAATKSPLSFFGLQTFLQGPCRSKDGKCWGAVWAPWEVWGISQLPPQI